MPAEIPKYTIDQIRHFSHLVLNEVLKSYQKSCRSEKWKCPKQKASCVLMDFEKNIKERIQELFNEAKQEEGNS